MREDGFEFDRFLMTKDRNFKRPAGVGPKSLVKSGKLPAAHEIPAGYKEVIPEPAPKAAKDKKAPKKVQKLAKPIVLEGNGVLRATEFPSEGTDFYLDRDKWMAINPEKHKAASTSEPFPFESGRYDVTLFTVGENDGRSSYELFVGGSKIGAFVNPLAKVMYEEGGRYSVTWKNLKIDTSDDIRIAAHVASEDGKEYSRARWSRVAFKRVDGKPVKVVLARAPAANRSVSVAKPIPTAPLVLPRQPDGNGKVTISGELRQWHKVTLNLAGPYAHEQDNQPNPFTDYRMEVHFRHESGSPDYIVPGYFAADGKAGNSSAKSGTVWRAHLSPDKPGKWSYRVSFVRGKNVAISDTDGASTPFNNKRGRFVVKASDKKGRDFRGKGRLTYVGNRYLQFAGSKEYFLKAGADAPETFLGYKDFDDTVAGKPGKVPLKTWSAHVKDWKQGDPTWKNGKGKGMIGALNYLSGKGCNVFSFLPYNAGGDGDNVWPFTSRNDKFHYDCSKLDQWGIVFDHATELGLYLHFKLQETEIDDNRRGGHKPGQSNSHAKVPTSLDGGKLGRERKLYCREIIARFGHALALNWNLGEENTQSTEEQVDMARYIHDLDPYDHIIVIHTFPNQQDKVYPPLFGKKSKLSGFSLQNSNIRDSHWQVVKWVNASTKAGRPWVTAFDESGTAQYAQVPDLGYEGFNGFDKEGKKVHTQHEVRKYTLWGTLMGGGIGCEYYFGYKLPQNDLICEDWRSRDQSWDYCRIALDCFKDNKIPFWEMKPADGLVGTDPKSNDRYCLAKPGSVYLVYLPNGGTTQLDLSKVKGSFKVRWFDPRRGGKLQNGSIAQINGGKKVGIGNPPGDNQRDWLAVIRR